MAVLDTCDFCSSRRTDKVLEHHDNNCFIDQKKYTLVQCNACGLVFVANPPAPNEMGRYYPGTYYAYGTNRNVFFILKNLWIKLVRILPKRLGNFILFDQLYFYPQKSKMRTLDVGCGDGSSLHFLKSIGHAEVVGTEIDKKNCTEIEKRYGYRVVQATTVTDLDDMSFDAVRMNHVLEHVYDPAGTIAKVYQMLNKDGRFFVAVPNYGSLASRVFGRYFCGLQLPTHISHFKGQVIKDKLREEGFDVKRYRTVGLSGMAVSFTVLLRDRYGLILPIPITLLLVLLLVPLEIVLNVTGNGFMQNIEAQKRVK